MVAITEIKIEPLAYEIPVKMASPRMSQTIQSRPTGVSKALTGPHSDDVPLLVSDDGASDCDSVASTSQSAKQQKTSQQTASTYTIPTTTSATTQTVAAPAATKNTTEASERSQLMTIIVKYIATKIQNSFPQHNNLPNELPLDKFLLCLTSRLKLTLPMFLKGIIYLFRYMDIIYLLRYLNQSNNYANSTDMGFELKKLIVGCFKLALAREQRLVKLRVSSDIIGTQNWSAITGLGNHEINDVVKKIIGRMNGKLNIKNVELMKLKGEIFKYVKEGVPGDYR